MLLAAGFLLTHCTQRAGKSLLTIFFDGVPGADSSGMASGVIVNEPVDSLPISIGAPDQTRTAMVVHYPYQERECGACHNQNSLGEMVEPEPGLCYLCHEDLATVYKTLHGPVASGYCTSCHDPHMAQKEHLLRYTGKELCFYCHRSSSVLQNEMHQDLDDMTCTDCHNPHGGDDRYILY